MIISGKTRYLIYSFECLAAFVLQSVPCCAIEISGAKGALTVSLALSIAVFEGEVVSILFAAICGVISDISFSGTIGFFSIAMTIVCYFISLLFENYFKRNLFTVLIVSFAGIVLVLSLHFFIFFVIRGYTDGWQFFIKHYIPRIFCTLLAVAVFYGIECIFATGDDSSL